MSFLTPARLQDASRILRGIGLVAAKAAADSPALRRAGQGDLNSAVKEAMKSLSQQSKQIAEILDATSREQTGASMEHHMRRSRDAAEGVASVFSERAQGVVRETQQAAQAAAQQPKAVVDNIVYEGRRLVDSASRNVQQTAKSSRQTVDSMAKQGQDFAQRAAPQGAEAVQSAASNAQGVAQGVAQRTEETVEYAAPSRPIGDAKSMVLDFSGGSGTASTGAGGNQELPSAAKSSEASGEEFSASSPSPPPSPPQSSVSDSTSMGPGSQGIESAARPAAASLDSSPEAQAGPAQGLGTVGGETQGTSIADASEVLRSHSESGNFSSEGPDANGQGPEPPLSREAASEAEQLLDEERKLTEKEAQVSGSEKAQVQAKKEEVKKKLKERRVPSSPIGRVAGFAQLGASLVYGTVADQVSSYFGGQKQEGGNKYMTERNAERLADALCRMRGAALKLGQMISIQDESVLPPQLAAAFERVRAGADVMPQKQLHKAMAAELGSDWRSKVADFEDEPLAAASIGQVHGATLHDGRRVVMKIQYPGVARSIESDVDNLLRIIRVANILPRGLYVENAAKVAKKELKLECDYVYEARCQSKFVELIEEDADFKGIMHVPEIIPELCSHSVLTSEWVPGVHIDKVAQMSQKIRDAVGTLLLQLTLKELFQWRFMQTDPNWGNFLYDEAAGKLNLIDFGAAREFPSKFVDNYLEMVKACAEKDRDGVIDSSTKLGFLTGDESNVMMDAHSNAGFVVGTPFSNPGLYDFASHASLTKQVSQLGAVMLKHRLTPPPEESYSLHRKLSGAFLACIKLRAKVPCHELFFTAYEKHKWGHEGFKTEDLPDLKLATG